MKKDDNSVVDKIVEILNNIRPYINMDGGDIEFIKYEDHYVYIKLLGACANCGFIDETIENGILESIQSEVSEVEGVINVSL